MRELETPTIDAPHITSMEQIDRFRAICETISNIAIVSQYVLTYAEFTHGGFQKFPITRSLTLEMIADHSPDPTLYYLHGKSLSEDSQYDIQVREDGISVVETHNPGLVSGYDPDYPYSNLYSPQELLDGADKTELPTKAFTIYARKAAKFSEKRYRQNKRLQSYL